MLYVPRHLPNKLECKVLSCISVYYQSRMASNGIASTPSHPCTLHVGGRVQLYVTCSVGVVCLGIETQV